MAIYREEGVVLRHYQLGESDRIVVLLTKGRGKIRAVAKGIRKTKSKFGGRLEPGSFVAVQMYEGRGELHLVSQVETIESFRYLREDLDKWVKACALLEATERFAQEEHEDLRLLRMLLGAMRALEKEASPLLVPGFFLKLLALEGFEPQLDVCNACGESEGLCAFDPIEGGIRCSACRQGLPLSADALHLMRMVLRGGMGEALKIEASKATTEVDQVATRWLEECTERRLRSVGVAGTL